MTKQSDSLTELQQQLLSAYAMRQKLSEEDTKRLQGAFGKKMAYGQAWRVVNQFGSGQLDECADDLIMLARAWLTLGEDQFEVLFRATRLLEAVAKKAFKHFRQFVAATRRLFPTVSVRKLRIQLRPLWFGELPAAAVA